MVGLQAEGQVTLEQIDPELAKQRAEEEEERRLAAIRSQGEAVTPETFQRWRQRYDAESSLRNNKCVQAFLVLKSSLRRLGFA